jgi:hypothetical protein
MSLSDNIIASNQYRTNWHFTDSRSGLSKL